MSATVEGSLPPLAWLLLPAHTIRTLSKHPGRAASPPVDTGDAAFVMQVVDQLFRAGRVPIIADLTNVLLRGGRIFGMESGHYQDATAIGRVVDWLIAARAARFARLASH